MSIAAVGDPTFIAGFRMIGAEGFRVATEDDLRSVLMEILKTDRYALIILPDSYVETTVEIRSRAAKEGRVTPIFSFISDYTGVRGKRVDELKKSVSVTINAPIIIINLTSSVNHFLIADSPFDITF